LPRQGRRFYKLPAKRDQAAAALKQHGSAAKSRRETYVGPVSQWSEGVCTDVEIHACVPICMAMITKIESLVSFPATEHHWRATDALDDAVRRGYRVALEEFTPDERQDHGCEMAARFGPFSTKLGVDYAIFDPSVSEGAWAGMIVRLLHKAKTSGPVSRAGQWGFLCCPVWLKHALIVTLVPELGFILFDPSGHEQALASGRGGVTSSVSRGKACLVMKGAAARPVW
jgi:hypothetical protein